MPILDERERANVLEDLRSPDEEVRRLAVERIFGLAPDEVLPRLVERLGDSDWRVRKAAIARLVALSDRDASCRALIGALADGENPGRRNAAVEALVEIGESSVDVLIDSCDHDDADVRKFVVDALAGIGSERSVDALVARLEDGDPNVRAAAADALGAVGGDAARDALCAQAVRADQDPLVRFSALHALDTLEVPLRAEALATVLDDPMLGPAGLALLGRCEDDPGALGALLKGLASGVRASRESSIRGVLRLAARLDGAEAADLEARLAALVASEPGVVQALVDRLGDSDLATQLVLVQFLGLIRAREAVIPILESGYDEALAQVAFGALESMGAAAAEEIDAAWSRLDPLRRSSACEVLGRVGGARAVERLIGGLGDPDPSLRAAAARALAALGEADALAPLVQRLGRTVLEEMPDDEDEQHAIADAIVAIAGPDAEGRSPAIADRAVELLVAAMADAGEETRLSVSRVLGSIARAADADLVAMLMKDPSAEVRGAAVDAIARIEASDTPEALRLAIADEAPLVRLAAARALGASGEETDFEDLRRLADDEDARVRAVAVRAIGRRFGAASEPAVRARALAELNRACEDEAPVALSVVESACEIGGDAVAYVAPLLSRAEPEVVLGAARCLGLHAPQGDLEVLLPLVSHPDWSVRAEVVELLGERRFRQAVPTILRRLETEQDDFVRRVTLAALQKLES